MYEEFIRKKMIVKLLLCWIPFLNWYTEIRVRWNYFDEHRTVLSAIMFGLSVPFGVILGYVDAICLLITFGTFGLFIVYRYYPTVTGYTNAEEYEVTVRRKK